jgi:hypothetical protein
MTGSSGSDRLDIERLLARIREEGVPLPRDAVLAAVEEPRWETTREYHDWRRHVPPAVRTAWSHLPLRARLCIFETAELMALDEAEGAAMITGPEDAS